MAACVWVTLLTLLITSEAYYYYPQPPVEVVTTTTLSTTTTAPSTTTTAPSTTTVAPSTTKASPATTTKISSETSIFRPDDLVLDVRANPGDNSGGGSIVFPGGKGAKCEDATTQSCISIDDCPAASRGKMTICGWDDNIPRICCSKLLAKSVKEPLVVPTTPKVTSEEPFLLTKELIPESQCFRQVERPQLATRVRRQFPDNFLIKPGEIFMDNVPHVVGGKDVTSLNIWPFMVSIFKQIGRNSIFLCGGSLISKRHVLSAAHCFMDRDENTSYIIRTGLVDLRSIESLDVEFGQFTTKTVIRHPDFRFPILYNDIAILVFNGLSNFSTNTQPICLSQQPSNRDLETGTATLLGWGSKQSNEVQSKILQEAVVPMVNRSFCQESYLTLGPTTNSSFPQGISNSLLCAGNINVSKDACRGDSGGPLVDTDANGTVRQIGVVSVGFDCGRLGFPGIYTNVEKYIEWILQTAAKN